MKLLGSLLLTAGFLAGAYSTALDTVETHWTLFIPAAIAALVGVVLIKRSERGDALADDLLTANRAELTESLARIIATLDNMSGSESDMRTDDIRAQIDSRLREDLLRFADARESMVHLFGLQVYADVMSAFAAGERYVNRVWSASADGYRNEAFTYLQKAAGQFRNASQQLSGAASAG
jgi:hypothetical protein